MGPGHDNSYSNRGMLIRWEKCTHQLSPFQLRNLAEVHNLLQCHLCQGFERVAIYHHVRQKAWDERRSNAASRILISVNICFSTEVPRLHSYFLFLMPKVICFLLPTLKLNVSSSSASEIQLCHGQREQTLAVDSFPMDVAVSGVSEETCLIHSEWNIKYVSRECF